MAIHRTQRIVYRCGRCGTKYEFLPCCPWCEPDKLYIAMMKLLGLIIATFGSIPLVVSYVSLPLQAPIWRSDIVGLWEKHPVALLLIVAWFWFMATWAWVTILNLRINPRRAVRFSRRSLNWLFALSAVYGIAHFVYTAEPINNYLSRSANGSWSFDFQGMWENDRTLALGIPILVWLATFAFIFHSARFNPLVGCMSFVAIGLLPVAIVLLVQSWSNDEAKRDNPAHNSGSHSVQIPTLANVSYGRHPRQVLDFYQVKSDKPTPLVLYIHGDSMFGGWRSGDKWGIRRVVSQFHQHGISVAAINYRFVKQAGEIKPPVKAPLHDAARALQFIRSKAEEWNIDAKRIGATGDSAGGCSSLWLALHDDMAKPDSEDPIARESTRLYCAAVNRAQTTLDPIPLLEWVPNYYDGAHAFGLKKLKHVSAQRESLLDWINEYSPMSHVSNDDPPIAMFYRDSSKKGDSPKDPTHSVLQGLMLEEKLKAAGVEVYVVYPGRKNPKYRNSAQFLIERLKLK